MGQRSHRDQIDPGLGNRPDRLEAYVARDFQPDPGPRLAPRAADFIDPHVVQEDRIGACAACLLYLLERLALDLNQKRVGSKSARALDRSRYRTCGRDVVVLDQNSAVEPEAVIVSAADPYRVFFQGAQPRVGLASVDDPRGGPCHRLDEPIGQRRYSGEQLNEIQRDPLAGQQTSQLARVLSDHHAGLNPRPFLCELYYLGLRAGHREYAREDEPAGEDHLGLLDNYSCPSAFPRGYRRLGGEISVTDILGQGAFDCSVELGEAYKFHEIPVRSVWAVKRQGAVAAIKARHALAQVYPEALSNCRTCSLSRRDWLSSSAARSRIWSCISGAAFAWNSGLFSRARCWR